MDTADLLKKVRKIEIKTRGLSRNLFAGDYHSTFKGRGMSFSEVRTYQYGDDVRNIDWNVTARSNEAHVKTYEEEREMTMMLLVDMSRSAFFGSAKLKSEVITEISAILAFSAIQNNDKVGVIFFSDRIEKFIPPKKGKRHILLIIRELIDFEPQGKGTNLTAALKYLNNVSKKKAIAFLISDFIDKGYDDALRIAARRHDLIGIRLHDINEETLPEVGLVHVHDAESGEKVWLDTSDKNIRARFAYFYEEKFNYFKTTFLKSGADALSISTAESYVNALHRFFKAR
jgi:uncharacterized protein (DUF58 family)